MASGCVQHLESTKPSCAVRTKTLWHQVQHSTLDPSTTNTTVGLISTNETAILDKYFVCIYDAIKLNIEVGKLVSFVGGFASSDVKWFVVQGIGSSTPSILLC